MSDLSSSEIALTDVTVFGPRTRMRGVRAPNIESRSWLESFPVCQALNQYQMIHIGIEETRSPMRIVRTKQTSTYFLACIGGQGSVLVDGRWRICREGFACLLPAHTLNAFQAMPGKKWEFCWVCYQQPTKQRPIANVTTPVMAEYDPLPLRSAILGLMYECNGPAQPTLIQEWTDLVHAYVLRFAQPSDQPDQLRLLWERVAAHLGDEWSLTRLASVAGYSNEHLRRLCQRQMGRSPMHQVTYLRMRSAAELLATTEQTVESISQEVGYQNPFVFSNAFTKWIGWRPSEYRRKKSSRT
ncbi:MAG: AraC family transcriptional regulator [Verrucomicrobiota bacterium]|jgi:AraC-like DNA-binding protein